jgi:NhaP-type Na+/H+ or K+/H+ antiporter
MKSNLYGPVTLTDAQQLQLHEKLVKIGKTVIGIILCGGLTSIIVIVFLKNTTDFSLSKLIIILVIIFTVFFIIAQVYNVIASHNLLRWTRDKSNTNEKYGIK